MRLVPRAGSNPASATILKVSNIMKNRVDTEYLIGLALKTEEAQEAIEKAIAAPAKIRERLIKEGKWDEVDPDTKARFEKFISEEEENGPQ